MILVVIIPAFVWIALLLAAWATLVYLACYRLRIRHRAMVVLLAVTALQTLAGLSAAIATSVYQISKFACLMGYYGAWVTAGAIVAEIAVLLFLATIWPRNSGGERHRMGAWVSIWFIFSLIVLLTHLRSAVLCTV